MRFLTSLAFQSVVIFSWLPSVAFAGIWATPTGSSYTFPSLGEHSIALASGIILPFSGTGATIARSDPIDAAFVQDGFDTINAEIQSLHLVGSVPGHHAELLAGVGQGFAGFLALTEPTRGQIQDQIGSPQDGTIDFPADSFFDVFFDVWVDLNNDGIPDVGEVLSNDVVGVNTFAARMANNNLLDIPPPDQSKYSLVGGISELDPEIGTFQAVPAGDVNLYVIDTNRQSLGFAGTLVPGSVNHIVTPEPASVCVWVLMSSLGVGAGWRSRRKQTAATA